jgi:hypothetical protein
MRKGKWEVGPLQDPASFTLFVFTTKTAVPHLCSCGCRKERLPPEKLPGYFDPQDPSGIYGIYQ